MTLRHLFSAVILSACFSSSSSAQNQPPISRPGPVPPSPVPVLPGTVVPQSQQANQLPIPIQLQIEMANQQPVPEPLQTVAANQQTTPTTKQPNPPPIPPSSQTFPESKPPQQPIKEPGERFKKMEEPPGFPEIAFGNGHWCWTGWRYGPRVAPSWEYPGLGGGPQITYPWGKPGYTGHNDERSQEKSCRLWGPPVPVYTPVPEVNTEGKHKLPNRNVSSPGLIYGWVGPFPASPRFKHYDVNVFAQPGVDLSTGRPLGVPDKPPSGGGSDQKKSAASMTLTLKVPHPEAEVYVDGVKTAQTGIERTFISPDLEPGKDFRYELTVRWLDQGVKREQTKIVLGSSGQIIPLDFTAPEVIRAEK